MNTRRTISPILYLIAAFLSILYMSSDAFAAQKYTDQELGEIYSQVLCTKCGPKRDLDSHQCPMADEKRALVKARLEEGHTPEEVIRNFNGDNIAFMFNLPLKVIRETKCPCACAETLEICIGELRGPGSDIPGCPVIDDIMVDIRTLQRDGKTDEQIIAGLQSEVLQSKYRMIIDRMIYLYQLVPEYAAIKEEAQELPKALLDAECSCSCTEPLGVCVEQMPWCERVIMTLHHYPRYQKMGLTVEEIADATPAPCGKTCAKNVTGKYLGINGAACSRPVRDAAYYRTVDGEEVVFCCESCATMTSELPDEILDNVTCKLCGSNLPLRDDQCAESNVQRMLIKTWLQQGKTSEWIIDRFSDASEVANEEKADAHIEHRGEENVQNSKRHAGH